MMSMIMLYPKAISGTNPYNESGKRNFPGSERESVIIICAAAVSILTAAREGAGGDGKAGYLSKAFMGAGRLNFQEPENPALYKGASLLKKFLLLPRSLLQLRQVEINGTAKGDDSDFTLIYIGEGESLKYLKDLCFASIHNENLVSCSILYVKKRFKPIQTMF